MSIFIIPFKNFLKYFLCFQIIKYFDQFCKESTTSLLNGNKCKQKYIYTPVCFINTVPRISEYFFLHINWT